MITWRSRLYRAHLGPGWRPAADEAVRRCLQQSTVLITGASSGIGRATAIAAAAHGAHVIGLARRTELLTQLQHELSIGGATATMISCDLADPDDTVAAIDQLAHRPLDIVISNAGLSLHRTVAASRDPDRDLSRSLAINLSGPAQLITGLLPQLGDRGGHIVNIGSVSALAPTAGWAAYAASKAGFDAWFRAVAGEVSGNRVAASTVHFPLVSTSMSAPTYRTRWALTADEAASIILAVLVRRPRMLAPWWARLAAPITAAAPQLFRGGIR